VTTAALEVPFEPAFREADDVRLLEAPVLFGLLRELEERGLAEDERLFAEDERLLAAEERLLAAVLRLFVPEALRLLVPEPPLLFGLDPFELLDAGFRLLVERELAWAMSPSLGRCPRALKFAYPVGRSPNSLGMGLRGERRKPGRGPGFLSGRELRVGLGVLHLVDGRHAEVLVHQDLELRSV
jgi:hypothetical protein